MGSKKSALAEIVVANPGAARVFLRRGLDFCCNGRRSLEEACAQKGIDPKVVLEEIERGDAGQLPRIRWDRRPLGDLVDFILERFHQPLRKDIPELIGLARTVERVHAGKPACPRGLADHLDQVRTAVEGHLAKEEQILFPLIVSGRGSVALMPIKVMMQEHEDHGRNLRRTRALAGDFAAPPEACESWRQLYQGLARLEAELMEHIHLENNILFPRALEDADGAGRP